MTKGVRWIDGREYLLAGRTNSKKSAVEQAEQLRKSWLSVRVIKLWDYDFLLYAHGSIREANDRLEQKIPSMIDEAIREAQRNVYPRPSVVHYSTEAKEAGWRDRS